MLINMGKIPVLYLLEYKKNSLEERKKSPQSQTMQSIENLFDELEENNTAEATASLLYTILLATVKPTFHKINVHAAMTPADVKDQFEPAIVQAKDLQEKYYKKKQAENKKHDSSFSTLDDMPFVTVKKHLNLKFTFIIMLVCCHRSFWMKWTHHLA